MGAPGFEPGTSALSGLRSNQLSYAPVRGETHLFVAVLCRTPWGLSSETSGFSAGGHSHQTSPPDRDRRASDFLSPRIPPGTVHCQPYSHLSSARAAPIPLQQSRARPRSNSARITTLRLMPCAEGSGKGYDSRLKTNSLQPIPPPQVFMCSRRNPRSARKEKTCSGFATSKG